MKCPYCNEKIKSGAIKCRHCHEILDKGKYYSLKNKSKEKTIIEAEILQEQQEPIKNKNEIKAKVKELDDISYKISKDVQDRKSRQDTFPGVNKKKQKCEKDQQKKCPVCDTPVSADIDFCPNCNVELFECEECGEVVTIKDEFCKKCNTAFENDIKHIAPEKKNTKFDPKLDNIGGWLKFFIVIYILGGVRGIFAIYRNKELFLNLGIVFKYDFFSGLFLIYNVITVFLIFWSATLLNAKSKKGLNIAKFIITTNFFVGVIDFLAYKQQISEDIGIMFWSIVWLLYLINSKRVYSVYIHKHK